MINLLPSDTKRNIRAARTNVLLLRYNLLTLTAIAGVVLICAFFYVYLSANQLLSASKTSDNSAKAAAYSKTRTEADEYKKNLSVAKTILGNSVNYTSTVFAITELLPAGVVLDTLNLNATDFGKQTVFLAHAKTFAQASQLKENFQKSKLFSNVFFQSITSEDSTTGYPVSVALSAQLNKASQQ